MIAYLAVPDGQVRRSRSTNQLACPVGRSAMGPWDFLLFWGVDGGMD